MPEPIVTLNEEGLNGLLEEVADDLVGAERHGRTAEREAHLAGHCDRSLTTSSGEVTIHMPKLKGMRFTAAIIERYRRRETSVEEAMIAMYLAGVSTRRIEDVSEALRGSSVSAATVSNLNEKAFASVEEWRNRPLDRAYPYVYVDGIYLKISWGDSHGNVAVMVAIGVNDDGYREVIGAAEGFTESAGCWRELLSWLKSRGLRGVRMFTGDKAAGMVGSIAEVFPARRTSAAPCTSTATCWRGCPSPGGPRSRPCSGRSTPWSRAKLASQGPRGRLRTREVQARGGGQGRPRGLRGDPDLHALPEGALAAHTHEQRHRATQPRDPQTHPRGRDVSRREERPHARDRQAQVRRRESGAPAATWT